MPPFCFSRQKPSIPAAFKPREPSFGTSPMVGNRRVYGEDTIRRLTNTSSAKYLGLKPPSSAKSAPSGRQSSATGTGGRAGRRLSTPGSMTFVDPTGPAEATSGGGGAAPAVTLTAPTTQTGPGTSRSATGMPAAAQQADSFVGKMRGVSTETSLPRSATESGHNLSKRQKRPCLSRNLDHILGEPR